MRSKLQIPTGQVPNKLQETSSCGVVVHDRASNSNEPLDLTERTGRIGEAVIAMCKRLPRGPIADPLIQQGVRSSTSIGANYCEANDADSKRDFRRRINICLRETKETQHWLRMLAAGEPVEKDEARRLWQEAQELRLIFGAIRAKL